MSSADPGRTASTPATPFAVSAPATASTPAEVDRAVRAADAARPALADRPRRAALLRTAAALLAAAQDEIIATADAETGLGAPRLGGELTRTHDQLLAFAEHAESGALLDATIDHADPAARPAPRPDLRRIRVPLGVVAVFTAGNFPLAFGVPGGDTASALAAGCPVVLKAHPGHPATGDLCARLLRLAAARTGLPEDVVGVVHGLDAGRTLVEHPLTTAVGFTGSLRGGRALHDLAAARPRPIPFHGELGSLNPVLVTEAAAAARGPELGAGLAASFTLGLGQLCTKPGLVLVPEGPAGDTVVAAAAVAADGVPAGRLLDGRIDSSFRSAVRAMSELPEVETVSADVVDLAAPDAVRPRLLAVPAARLATGDSHRALLEECFGPLVVLARYRTPAEAAAVLARIPGSLTATVHLAEDERGSGAAELIERLTALAGRVVVDGWPTGVAVTAAMHHGGPYPAATTAATSVGTAAAERWLRPVVYQNTPQALLPPELRDDNPLGVPRRVNGRAQL
ncbi:NADP-dependent aldehyde dehydrogenase [Streptomyces sp. TLI_053]|uniref:aldehyde dehydrogenase family protein n=1 Tax=Streptomyces sp. TLI_053 TaxID=1855352 RepID=UPI00087A5C19|nr:aldehyde dehydrogenase family protein [Streptomyces sp. TLI_053]SDT82747.1 NADP-dependent aldehyde dehydrogenase [Streptomyces sp. TLI_053]